MTTTSVTQPLSTPGDSVSNTAANSPTANKNMFLSLLVAQMKNQDPMQPTDSTQWIAQMAQFTEVEQVSNMADSQAKVASALGVSQTEALLGKQVSYTDNNGATQTGTVQKVDISAGKAMLEVNGQAGIDPSTVTQVQ